MKKETFYEKTRYSLILVIMMLALVSCSDDSSEISQTQTEADLFDIEAVAEVESIGEILDDFSEILSFDFESSEALKSEVEKSDLFTSYFSDCVIVTVVIEGDTVNIKLDFGDGCTGPHDHILKGAILTEIQHLSKGEMSVIHTFENFFVNEREITGSISKLRVKQNIDGFPQADVTRDLTVIWNDELSFTHKGQITRTWIEGFENRNWGDNVFVITGSWKVSKNEETLRTVEIVNPLRREMACRFLVSGTLQIEARHGTYLLDFGNGDCDNLATVSKGDLEIQIELDKLRRLKK